MNLSELLILTRHVLDETVEDSSHWSDTRLTLFLNWGQGDVVSRLSPPLVPQLKARDEKNLVIGTDEYALPTDYMKLEQILLDYDSPSTPEKYVPAITVSPAFRYALLHNPLWLPSTTDPYAIIENNKVHIFPIPTTLSVDGLRIYYTKQPTEMSGVGDSPELPAFTHRWIVDYAVYIALFEDGDRRYVDKFAEYLEHFGSKRGN